jgi:hypothetical protein
MTLALAAQTANLRNAVEGNMSNKKTDPTDLTYDNLLADTMLRVTALEKILLDKGLITTEELTAVTEALVEKVTKVIMEKVESAKNLDDFVESLGSNLKDKLKN